MVFPREFTPHPRRRRPTIPLPASRASVNAVPFSPRSSPPPSTTPTPPPTPLNLPPFTNAFDPLNMLASSSAAPAVARQVVTPVAPTTAAPPPSVDGPYFLGDLFREQEDKGKGVLGVRAAGGPPRIPKARDIRMVGRPASPVPSSPAASAHGRSARSPPSPASPVAAPPPPQNDEAAEANGGAEDDEAPATTTASDEEEEISVESDDLDDGVEYVEVWVAEGDWERAARYAYVELEPLSAAANPAPLIRGALLRAAPTLRYQILPSAHGVALLHFDTVAAREEALLLQPIEHHGTLVKLNRIENTDDRFVREPAWLAHVVCWNYPEEHWDADRVCALYNCIGTVREIDYECIPGWDRSCLRFVLELQHPHVPYRVGVHPPSGRGIILRQQALRFWPRAEQFDENGNWIPYFGHPPPPQGPAGGPAQLPPPPQMFGPPPPPQAPAPVQPPPILPGAFPGAQILHHGYINSFPLPRLPALPLVVHLPPTANPTTYTRANSTLLLPWYATTATSPNMLPPPPPPPSPAYTHPPEDAPVPVEEMPPPIPRPRARRNKMTDMAPGKRNSERLAAKDSGKFVHASEKASQLKALKNSLALCSQPVQKLVIKKKLLKQTKKPIANADLTKLADAVGIGKDAVDALDRVLATGAAMGNKLDQVLADFK
ncbi:unnamed protein product [Urochloa humidicola]